jgi:hypothetical protein
LWFPCNREKTEETWKIWHLVRKTRWDLFDTSLSWRGGLRLCKWSRQEPVYKHIHTKGTQVWKFRNGTSDGLNALLGKTYVLVLGLLSFSSLFQKIFQIVSEGIVVTPVIKYCCVCP